MADKPTVIDRIYHIDRGYESIEENIPTLAKTKYELNEDGIYDESLEFEYDKTQETDTMITDAELFRLLNDDLNIC